MNTNKDEYREEIIGLASECLNCNNPNCMKGCPIKTEIPKFIKAIKVEKLNEAYEILQGNNIMSEICCRICPTEMQCMGSCIRGIKSNPVNIAKLEQFVNDWAVENNIKIEEKKEIKSTGKKVAIIGSGPAGIFCAWELSKKGHSVTIFEKQEILGGLLRYGIPDFRLDKEIVKRVTAKLEKYNIDIHTNTAFGKDIDLSELQKKFDAIFLCLGAEEPNTYDLGVSNENIKTSINLLYMHNKGEKLHLGKTAIIGGGNVAMDMARVAKEDNSEDVYVIYRKSINEAPARKIEIEETLNSGVKIIENTTVIKAIEDNGKLSKILCRKTDSEFEIDVDTVVFAIGQKANKGILKDIEFDGNFVKVDENNMTSIKGVFAGGDITGNRSTVCRAIASARKTAIDIDKYLKGE